MQKIIIGIHGLGNKPPEELLKYWWELSIEEGLKKKNYKIPKFSFELVYWADILHPEALDINERDTKSPLYISEKYFPAESSSNLNGFKNKTLGFIEKKYDKLIANTVATLKYPYLTELFIHNYLEDLEIYYANRPIMYKGEARSAKQLITERLAETLKKHKNKKILLVAHSMGSIIAHDVLSEVVSEVEIDTLVTIGSPLGQKYIVNKMSENTEDEKIDKLKVPENIIGKWVNIADSEDEFAFEKKLKGIYKGNTKGIEIIDKLVNNDYSAEGLRNHHKIYGYLRTAEFSDIFNSFFAEDKSKIYLWIKQKIDKFF